VSHNGDLNMFSAYGGIYFQHFAVNVTKNTEYVSTLLEQEFYISTTSDSKDSLNVRHEPFSECHNIRLFEN
jgi:hypothetical protein